MTTLYPKHERLQSYLDGELETAARTEFEADVAADPALQEELDRALRLRGLLEEAPAAFASPDPGELAFERVRQSIHDALKPAASPVATKPAKAKIVPINSARRSRRMFFGSVVAFAAAAAVVVIAFGEPSSNSGGVAANPLHPAPTSPAPVLNGTEIVRVEFGKMSGTYWEQNEGDDRVAVVWIDDTFPEEVGRP